MAQPSGLLLGKRKRPEAPLDDSAGVSEQPLTASKMPKTRTYSSPIGFYGPTTGQLDLVYPFWFQNSSGGGGGTVIPPVNPPLLDPAGPLYVQNNMLRMRTGAPIVVSNGALGLSYDTSLGLSDQNQLQVNLEPNGPLKVTDDGIELTVDPLTLEVTDWELGVKIDPAGPLDASTDGLTLRTDDTLSLGQDPTTHEYELGLKLDPSGPLEASADGLNLRLDDTLLVEQDVTTHEYELGVHLNPNGPVTADENGIDLEINTDTLTVTAGAAGGGGELSVLLNPQGAIRTSGSAGIGVAVGSGLQIASNAVSIKPDPAGPISASSTGLTLNYDNSDFAITDGKLTLYKTPAVTSDAYLISGNSAMTTYTASFATSSNYQYRCSYFLQQWLRDRLVITSLYIKLDRSQLEYLSSDTAAQNARYFTFWVSSNSLMNLSGIDVPVITPSTVAWNKFLPDVNYTNPPPFNFNTSIYFEPPSGEILTFNPVTTGDWNTPTYSPGTVSVCVLPVNVQASTGTLQTLLCFNFRCANSGLFKTAATTGTFYVGPIVYSCPGNRLI